MLLHVCHGASLTSTRICYYSHSHLQNYTLVYSLSWNTRYTAYLSNLSHIPHIQTRICYSPKDSEQFIVKIVKRKCLLCMEKVVRIHILGWNTVTFQVFQSIVKLTCHRFPHTMQNTRYFQHLAADKSRWILLNAGCWNTCWAGTTKCLLLKN